MAFTCVLLVKTCIWSFAAFSYGGCTPPNCPSFTISGAATAAKCKPIAVAGPNTAHASVATKLILFHLPSNIAKRHSYKYIASYPQLPTTKCICTSLQHTLWSRTRNSAGAQSAGCRKFISHGRKWSKACSASHFDWNRDIQVRTTSTPRLCESTIYDMQRSVALLDLDHAV